MSFERTYFQEYEAQMRCQEAQSARKLANRTASGEKDTPSIQEFLDMVEEKRTSTQMVLDRKKLRDLQSLAKDAITLAEHLHWDISITEQPPHAIITLKTDTLLIHSPKDACVFASMLQKANYFSTEVDEDDLLLLKFLYPLYDSISTQE